MNCGTMFPTFVRDANWTATQSAAASYIDEVGMAAHPQAGAPNLAASLSRLVELLEENGEDDYGQISPTQFAFLTAYRMVERAEALAGPGIASSPAVDSEGGIRISWRRGDRQVKLVCPASPEMPIYIYWCESSTDVSSVQNQNVTADALAEKLSWLTSREQQSNRRAAA
ncbi:MAG TPA: hypothetical protein VGE89_15900 [Bryobacteraceae bacterium]|jgi:hypothetical protein